jgi:hypothetical protein
LLMNEVSVKRFSHRILDLFDELVNVTDGLLPTLLVPPRGIPLRGSINPRSEPLRNFIGRIDEMGNPNNRYRYYSMYVDKFDLHKLDETCFQLRRLCIPLDMIYMEPDLTYRQALRNDPSLQLHDFRIPRPPGKNQASKLLSILRRRNFSYFPEEAYLDGQIESGGTAYNSPIYTAIQFKSSASSALRWIIDNAFFNNEDRNAILKQLGED